MTDTGRVPAEQLHRLMPQAAPWLAPCTGYGVTASARDGKVLHFCQPASKLRARHAALGFSDGAAPDEGRMWPSAFALRGLGPAEQARVLEFVRRAVAADRPWETRMDEDRTAATERTLPHPPEAVFAAFETPERLAAWWGPAGFSNEFERFDFRVGGRWVFVMQAPDGTRYPNENEFVLIERPSRIVLRHVVAPLFTLDVRLEPVAGGTRLVWQQVFDDARTAQSARHVVEPANEQNLDRLEAVLAPGG